MTGRKSPSDAVEPENAARSRKIVLGRSFQKVMISDLIKVRREIIPLNERI